VAVLAVATVVAGCAGTAPTGTPPITPGTSAAPREVIIVARDDRFSPPVVDLVPGETVVLRVVNGGLETHEAIIGDEAVQTAWEAAEAAVAGAPPGPTPAVSVPPELSGLRVVVRSGERQDVVWTVPVTPGLIVGCHIPGHYARGMRSPVRFVVPRASEPAT
jgi:uncharacterized cupredoxin-like copper-binding protein